jgi:tRNA (guanine37-N1)-methyltransferase
MQRVVILCGRYEGVDERVNELLCDQEISIGDYVLSGGELAALVVIDAVVRLLPGALGNPDSARFESFGADEIADVRGEGEGPPRSTHGSGGLLDYPHYTRPAEFRGVGIPDALMSGNHEVIKQWRRRMSLEKTLRNRPDLLEKAALTAEDERILRKLKAEQQRQGEEDF